MLDVVRPCSYGDGNNGKTDNSLYLSASDQSVGGGIIHLGLWVISLLVAA